MNYWGDVVKIEKVVEIGKVVLLLGETVKIEEVVELRGAV